MSGPLTSLESNPLQFTVETNQPVRLDRYTADHLHSSRHSIARLVTEGRVHVNGVLRSVDHLLVTGDVVDVVPHEVKSPVLVPHALDIATVYEDEALLVLEKPAGISVHPTWGEFDEPTVVSYLLHAYSGLSLFQLGELNRDEPDQLRPGIVHRLDKYTSGLLVVGKTVELVQLLKDSFRNRSVKKEYRALVDGNVAHESGFIDQPLGRSENSFQKYIVRNDGKESYTEFAVLGRYHGFNRDMTLVQVWPLTGRTHQIRVHFAHLRHPLIGDKLYGGPQLLPRYFLHAASLVFTHPLTQEELHLTSPLPAELQTFLDALSA